MTIFLDANDNEFIAQTNIKVTHGVNGEYSITGEIFDNQAVLQGIDRGWRLKFEDEYFYITYQKIRDENRSVSVEFDAVHQFFWDFSKSVVYEERDGTIKFEECLELIFKDSGYRYYIDPNLESRKFVKQNFGTKDRMSLFNSIISDAGVEFNVKGKLVSIYKEVGTDLSTVVRKNLNLNELKITRNIGNFITYQKGLGKWNDENDHSKGRLTVEYESPLAQFYGRLEGPPFSDERYTVAENLLPVIKKNVESSYSLSVEMSIEDLTRAGYVYTRPHEGDYIMVINDTLDFRRRVRIVSYTSSYDVKGNLIDHQVTCNDIGTVQRKDAGYTALVNKVKASDQSTAQALEIANRALVSADGKSTNYYGDTFPADNPKGTLSKGDLFYQQVGDRTIMHVWNGKEWIADPVVNELGALEEHVRTEFEKVNTSMQDQSEEHDRQVADILSKTQSVETIATQAKLDAASALARANQVKTEAIADARAQVATVSQALNTAKTELQSAIASADQKARDSQASATALRNDLNLQASKILAQAQAQTTLTNRVTTVETLADGTKMTVAELSKTVNAQTGQIDSVSKRTKTVEDGLTGLTARYENLSVGGTNLAELSEKKGWYNSGGFFSADKKYNVTELIPVENVDYTLQFWGAENNPENWVGIVYFDENKQYIPNSYWSFYPKTGYKKKVLNPQNAKYIAISYYNSNSKVQLEKGTIASDYKIPDVAMQRQIAEYHQSATENYANLAQSLQTADGKINDANTLIRQTAEGQEQLSTKLTETQGKVTTAETNIRQLVNDVSSKVSQTIFDNLKRTVESQGTAITQNQSAIALKAEKSYVDGVKTTADNALSKANANAQSISQTQAELEVTNDAVNTKVSQTEFNAVNQRLSTAETTIRTQAGLIEQRLTSTQVESAITAKGYQTKAQVDSNITGRGYITSSALQPYVTSTVLENKVRETAGSFERQITETKALIPTEISNRNLLKGTKDLSGNDAKRFNTSDKYLDFNIARSRPTTGYSDTFSAYTTIPATANDYIISFYAKSDVDGATLYCHFYYPNTTTKVESSTGYKGGTPDGLARVQVTTEWQRYWVKWSQRKTDTVKNVIIGRNNSADGVKTIEVAGVALYEGALNKGHFDAPEDLVTETKFHKLEETAEKFERSIVAGGDIYQAIETAKGLVQEVSGANGLKTQVSQLAGSYAIKKLTKAGDVLGQINLNPDGSVRINEGLISVGTKTYIQDGVITSAKIASLDAGKITTGTLDAANVNIINLNANKVVGLDADFIKSKIELAMIEWLKGKTISAQNGAMQINLNAGQMYYYTDKAALKRELTGYPTQFIKFATENYSNVPSGVIILGSNRWAGRGESHLDGGFAGFKIWNGMNTTKEIDIIEAVGDEFIMRAGTNENNGFIFNTAGFGFVPRVGNRGFIGDRDRYFKSGDFENIYLHQNGIRVNLVQLLRDMGGRI